MGIALLRIQLTSTISTGALMCTSGGDKSFGVSGHSASAAALSPSLR